jgi:hypothetical protein
MAADPQISAKKAKEAESKLLERVLRALQDGANKEAKLREWTLKRIEANPKARDSLKYLATKGCNQNFVLHETALFCGADKGLEKRAKHAKTQIKKIAARLERDADILWRNTWEFMADNYGRYYGPYKDVFGQPPLRDIAESLTVALSALSRHTHGKTIRNKHLVYLAYHIKAATKRPHYKEIARLVKCMPGHTHSNIVKLANDLGHKVGRQEKQDPEFFRAARERVQRDLSAWQAFFPQGNRSGR